MNEVNLKEKLPVAGRDERGFRLGHRPLLDGVRAVAVLSVIAFHDDLMRGGFLGVDIFFVLSGFLITTILVQEWNQQGSISLRKFYARRALRLLPALMVMLSFWLGFIFWFRPEVFRETYKAALATLFYYSDFVSALGWNVWLGALSHTWSLSIEEQFYLLWPLLLVLMLRLRVKPRQIIYLLLCGILALAYHRASLWATGSGARRLYHGLDTRADALLVGCMTSILVSYNLLPTGRWSLNVGRSLAVVSVLLLIHLGLRADWAADYMYLGVFTITAVGAAIVLVQLLNSPPAIVTLILESRLMVWTGRISYGLYLWHLPANEMVKFLSLSSPALFALRLALTFTFASLSYYLIERPCLRRQARFKVVPAVSASCPT